MTEFDKHSRHIVSVGGDTIEWVGDQRLLSTIKRTIVGTTDIDDQIDGLPIPDRPIWLHFTVRLLRLYRRHISIRLGQRCVFEPSCSRYAELVLRENGFFRGSAQAAMRLKRCRPGQGGVDLP